MSCSCCGAVVGRVSGKEERRAWRRLNNGEDEEGVLSRKRANTSKTNGRFQVQVRIGFQYQRERRRDSRCVSAMATVLEYRTMKRTRLGKREIKSFIFDIISISEFSILSHPSYKINLGLSNLPAEPLHFLKTRILIEL